MKELSDTFHSIENAKDKLLEADPNSERRQLAGAQKRCSFGKYIMQEEGNKDYTN